MGEGDSMGPLNPEMKRLAVQRQGDIKYPIRWTTLGQYLEYLQRKGVTPNVASFVGATTVRRHELGEKDVDPTPAQLKRMRALVRQAMKEGALGVGSSLIYAPATYAETPELVAITTEAAKCGGMYISHMRSEGNKLLEAVDELIEISKQSGAPAEIYHMKQARPGQLGQARPDDREDRGGARGGPAHHRRHVHLHRRRDRARRGDAALGPGGRARGVDQAAEGPGDARAAGRGNAHARRTTGKI